MKLLMIIRLKNNKKKITNCDEIYRTIDSLNNNTVKEHDSISVKTIRTWKDKICLVHNFNLIIKMQTFTESLLTTLPISILKSTDKHLQENYRRIAIVSNISKIIEKLIIII